MKSHRVKHTRAAKEDLEFKCDMCDYATSHSELHVKYHKDSVHLGLRPYKCDMCEKCDYLQ